MADVLDIARRNAVVLVNFAAERAIPVRKTVVSRIVETARCQNEITVEDEIAFWDAYKELAKELAPVTVDSIISTEGNVEAPGGRGARILAYLHPPSLARRTTRLYRLFAIIALLLLIFMQVVWVAGVTITQDVVSFENVASTLRKERAELEQAARYGIALQGTELSNVPAFGFPLVDVLEVRTGADPQLREISINITEAETRAEASYTSLRNWNRRWQGLMFFLTSPFDDSEYNRLDRDAKNRLELSTATMFLEALSKYVLPLLFGFLGATAYVLRRLEQELKSFTFSSKSPTGYSLRLALGPLAGIAVGLLVVAGSDMTSGEVVEILSISTLGPLALAFVAGYGVELIFAFMDRFIGSYIRK